MGAVIMNEPDHALEHLCHRQETAVVDFARTWPAIWKHTGESLRLVTQLAFGKAATLQKASLPEQLRVFLWQHAVKYETLALSFIAMRELDAAYTMLRNALEVCRVATFIGTDPSKAERWLKSMLDGQRLGSKFDASDPLQSLLRDLFDLTSAWGTHGHNMALAWTGEIRGSTVGSLSFGVSDDGIRAALAMWLSAFWMSQRAFVRAFYDTREAEFDESVREYDRLEKFCDGLLADLTSG
jgi:hypothetical protein